MKLHKSPVCILVIMMMTYQMIYAGTQPKFAIVPLIPNANNVSVPLNSSVVVTYQVTNKTKITRQLTLKALPTGVSQRVSGVSSCTNPFSLAPEQSCLLHILVNGAVAKAGIIDGPVVCKTKSQKENIPDDFLCSQAAAQDFIKINKVPAGTVPISILNSPLDLTAGGGVGFLSIRNDSLEFNAMNIRANLPSNLSALVTPAGDTCDLVPPGGTCQLGYTPPSDVNAYIFGTSFPIQGDNTTSINGAMFVKPPVFSITGSFSGYTPVDMTYDAINKIFNVTVTLATNAEYVFIQNHSFAVTFRASGPNIACPALLNPTGSDSYKFTGTTGSYTISVNFANGTCGSS